jgi:hypothetical protein
VRNGPKVRLCRPLIAQLIFHFNFCATKKVLWRFFAFLNQGSSKTPKGLFWGNPSQNNYKKVEAEGGQNCFAVIFSLPFFLLRFFAVSLHEELKNAIKMF